MSNTHSRTPPADALVIFGVTGDLARKKIFPALYAMVKRGVLNVPVVGCRFQSEFGTAAQARPGRHQGIRQDR